MARLITLAKRAAASEASVLIRGESGTGKERLARYLHDQSPRHAGPFVPVDCGALPEGLLESELFGHRRGAFTGAVDEQPGLFVAARGGTLFLDEIGETSPLLQLRLLRALQERRVRPVGASEERDVDVRVISATHRDLQELVRVRTFREDLYYRARVVELCIPPLRERRADIPHLAAELIATACEANRCGPCRLSPPALECLEAYPWPGNIRELDNAIERAVVLAEDKPTIDVADLPPEVRDPRRHASDDAAPSIEPLAEVERVHILSAMERLRGDRRAVAAALGISPNTLWRRLKAYGHVRSR